MKRKPGMNRSDGALPELDTRGEMSIFKHLEEIRRRLIYSLIAVVSLSVVGFYFAEQIFRFLSAPLLEVLPEVQERMVFTSLPEVFFVYIKVGLFTGIIASIPFLFYHIWKFVALGMYKSEKSRIVPFVIISTLFFLTGATFCYYQVFHWGFRFFIGFTSDSIVPMITLQEYLKFVTRLILVFGLIFEMPVASAFLASIGVITPGFLRKNRKYAVVVIFILAALLTPPDVVTQLFLAGPMLLLYECSILAAAIFGKPKED